MSFVYCTLMETFFNRFVFCLLLHLFAMEKVAPVPLFRPSCGRSCGPHAGPHEGPHPDPHADLTKTVKFGQISKISVALECLQQLQQNFSEVQPLYEFCNVILSKNFYFKKNQKWLFFVVKFLSTW